MEPQFSSSGEPARGKTASTDEIARFSAIADAWWDPNGDFRPLHQLNPVRVGYIRDAAMRRTSAAIRALLAAYKGLSLIDIGCGGGLASESLARLGAAIVGIDASEESVRVAELHAIGEGLDLRYRCAAPEDLVSEGQRFDIVLALEVVEHVADLDRFIQACAALRAPGALHDFRDTQSYAEVAGAREDRR